MRSRTGTSAEQQKQRRFLIRIKAPSETWPSFMEVDVSRKENAVDKDRVIGSAKVVKGKVKEAVGKAIGDTKLETEGKTDKIEGKVQNAIGGMKDTIRGT